MEKITTITKEVTTITKKVIIIMKTITTRWLFQALKTIKIVYKLCKENKSK